MANLNRLTEKIVEDAIAKSKEILSQAESEKIKIVDSKVKDAREIEEDIIKKAKSEAVLKKDRIVSNAHLQLRNKRLEAKQIVIEKVLNDSLDSLCNLPPEQYIEFIRNSILSLGALGDQNLILNEKGRAFITSEFVKELNDEILKRGISLNITLSNETRSFKGGFILEKNGIEINYTFEALIDSLRDELEYDITKVLFV